MATNVDNAIQELCDCKDRENPPIILNTKKFVIIPVNDFEEITNDLITAVNSELARAKDIEKREADIIKTAKDKYSKAKKELDEIYRQKLSDDNIVIEADAAAREMKRKAEEKAREIVSEAQVKAENMLKNAEKKAESYQIKTLKRLVNVAQAVIEKGNKAAKDSRNFSDGIENDLVELSEKMKKIKSMIGE